MRKAFLSPFVAFQYLALHYEEVEEGDFWFVFFPLAAVKKVERESLFICFSDGLSFKPNDNRPVLFHSSKSKSVCFAEFYFFYSRAPFVNQDSGTALPGHSASFWPFVVVQYIFQPVILH